MAKAVYNCSTTRELKDRLNCDKVVGYAGRRHGIRYRMIRVRGPTKVMAHLMFGLLVLKAGQLLKFAQKRERAGKKRG